MKKVTFFYLHGMDLALEVVDIFAQNLLARYLTLHLVQPTVEVIQVLAGLAELLLDGLLQRVGNEALVKTKILSLQQSIIGHATKSYRLVILFD